MNTHHIAVISVNKNKYSEAFIYNQNMLLPAHVHQFYGAYLPLYYGEKQSFLNLKNSHLLQASAMLFRKKLQKKIAAYCKQHQIKALLAHFGPTGVAMSEVSAITGIPFFVYFHGFDAYREAELRKYRQKYVQMFEKAAAIFAVSHDMVRQLETLGAPSEKTIYNPCGADLQVFKYADVSENPPIFLAVGRLEDKKNPLALIEAFKLVKRNIPEAKLKIVGKGLLLQELKAKIKTLNLQQSVELKGILSQHEIASEMRDALIFVQHSITAPNGDREGSPVSIMEAGAGGLPVVGTRHEGIKDIVIENETGFLTEPGNISEMAQRMTTLAMNRALIQKMGVNAHNHIKSHFSLEKNVGILWDTIKKSISQ